MFFLSLLLFLRPFSCRFQLQQRGGTQRLNRKKLVAPARHLLRDTPLPASLPLLPKKSGMTSRSRAHHAASFVKSIQLLGIPTSGNRAQGASTEHCAPPGRLAALIFSGIRTSDTHRFHPGRFRTRDSGQSDCASQILPKQH